ncbi:hypothetical protein [Domibacillus aminovorans]|uniref:Uncharacterized protein n=1 Tax=Domibacillus aminovorans TaxID=29332 RepID=A0A177L7E6_9BACI|nr:hypothetical protein [Domibacillus aminovorans]OAH61296.1 hypothetical protein AWH49_14010 [Domibacillus aminovorans]
MKEMFIEFTKNGSVYELSIFEDLLKITQDGNVIHIQLSNIYQQPLLDIGLENLNYIVGNLSEYIEFCETNQIYKGIEFDADEWEKHTKIYATMRYASPDGKINLYKKQIDSVQGNMRGFHGDSLIAEKYYPFVSSKATK